MCIRNQIKAIVIWGLVKSLFGRHEHFKFKCKFTLVCKWQGNASADCTSNTEASGTRLPKREFLQTEPDHKQRPAEPGRNLVIVRS